MNPNWLPAARSKQLAMAKNWSAVLSAQAASWNVPATEIAQLDGLTAAAEKADLDKTQAAEQSALITARCKAAFAELAEKMRFIKKQYFIEPPLTYSDLTLLELKPRDTVPAPIPPPSEQAEAYILRVGAHLLEVVLRVAGGGGSRNGVGFRVYWGVLSRDCGGIPAEESERRELTKVPASGEELPFSRFVKRRRGRFDFDAADSGKTAYFCVRLENFKGEPGPWGALFSAVIP